MPQNDAQTILIDPMGFVKLIQQLINPNRPEGRLDCRTLVASYMTTIENTAHMANATEVNPSSIPTRVDSATTSAVWELGMPPEVAMVAKRSFFVLIQAMIVLIA